MKNSKQKNKKQTAKSTPAVSKKKPKVQLTKEQVKQIRNRMAYLKKMNTNNQTSTQSILPYETMFEDGVCHISGKTYSMTVEFGDTNYQLATYDEKGSKFASWSDILNYFDNSIKFQFTYESQIVNKKELIGIVKIDERDDKYNDIRKEYSDYRCNLLVNGKNGRSIKRYLTFSLDAKSLKTARAKLNTVANEITRMFSEFKVHCKKLDGKERLEALYHSCNPFSSEPFLFDWALVKKGSYSTKDFIACPSMSFKTKSEFEIGDGYGSVTTINILAGELSDGIISDYLKSNGLVSLNFHIEPFDQLKALKYVRGKLSDVQKMKIDEQKKAFRSGYDSDILPENIQIYLEELKELLEDLNSRNERLFNVTLTVRNYSPTKEANKLQIETLKRVTQKNNCKLIQLDYMQKQAFASSLPLGYNAVPIFRDLRTSSLAVFIPFSTQEIFQRGGTYYGLNSVTKNMILANRKSLKNPNGLWLGTPGSGKSFSVKREIVDVFLTSDDDIIINDPEGEYHPIVIHLGGQVIKISSASQQYVNPMDVPLGDIGDSENPISDKSDFIISLCELVVGGKYGLTSEESSAIDKCTRRLYNSFFQNNPSADTMPILGDLLEEMRKADVVEVLSRVANSLEMYVTGSHNIFNHRTNVDINNRLVCFDVKELGSQLKKLAMLVIQEQVWNRVAQNRDVKSTHYYCDEFHLLLRDEQTAKYVVEIWKRFRKWGGIPNGITQNVKDLLASPEIENILDNSDFIYMLNQAAGDRMILQDKLNISDAQIKFVTNSGKGNGLIFFGDVILPFEDEFPEDTLMFKLLNTDPNKKKKEDTAISENTKVEVTAS